MNRLEVNQVGGFPMTTRILDEIQKAHAIFNGLGGLAGNMTILSGCTVIGSTVSDGVVYINGEVLEFRGGSTQTKVKIVEVVENLTFQNGNSNPVIKTRYVTFGSGVNAMDWADFKKPMETKTIEEAFEEKADKLTTAQLLERIEALEAVNIVNIPSGLIAIWGQAANLIPAGWSEYLPLRGRTAVGFDPNVAEFDVLGDFGGSTTHTLSDNELPKREIRDLTTGTGYNADIIRTSGGLQGMSSGGDSYSIMNPYRVVLYIQKN